MSTRFTQTSVQQLFPRSKDALQRRRTSQRLRPNLPIEDLVPGGLQAGHAVASAALAASLSLDLRQLARICGTKTHFGVRCWTVTFEMTALKPWLVLTSVPGLLASDALGFN